LSYLCFGFRGIVTEEYFFASFTSGKKWLLKRDSNMYVGNVASEYICDKSLFPKYEMLAGEYPVELYEHEKFKYSKYLYLVFQNWIEELNKKLNCIYNLLENYPEKMVYFRMGGKHSYELYTLLAEVYQKKIGGFIDNNRDCICKGFGLPIVPLEQLEENKIKAVILSSLEHRHLLKEEAKNIYPIELDVIDIYDILAKNGLCSDKPIYEVNMPDEKWNVGFPMQA